MRDDAVKWTREAFITIKFSAELIIHDNNVPLLAAVHSLKPTKKHCFCFFSSQPRQTPKQKMKKTTNNSSRRHHPPSAWIRAKIKQPRRPEDLWQSPDHSMCNEGPNL